MPKVIVIENTVFSEKLVLLGLKYLSNVYLLVKDFADPTHNLLF